MAFISMRMTHYVWFFYHIVGFVFFAFSIFFFCLFFDFLFNSKFKLFSYSDLCISWYYSFTLFYIFSNSSIWLWQLLTTNTFSNWMIEIFEQYFWTMTIIGFMKRIFIYKHSNDHLNWSHRCDVMTIRCTTRNHVLCSFIFNILMVINISNIFQLYLRNCFQYEYLSCCFFFCMKSVWISEWSDGVET